MKGETDRESLCVRLDEAVLGLHPDMVMVVTDGNVERCVVPLLAGSRAVADAAKVVLTPGEEHKDLAAVAEIWKALSQSGATRRSVVLNIGGGVVTDTGGFAAATFKRGIRTVNLPTTLLGAVDAAAGGKTGVDFNGLKNEIGAFHMPSAVVVSTLPFSTLPVSELMSGYAEMLKTALIADKKLYAVLLDPERILGNSRELEDAVKRCLAIKNGIVESDPTEKCLRKVLNFGHTAGHAFESLCLSGGTPVAHGEAVAHGILVELILSHMLKGYPSIEMTQYAQNILKAHYRRLSLSCKDTPVLLELMGHDKKNAAYGEPEFTLLKAVGLPETGCRPTNDDIRTALEIYYDIIG